jgi:hypothetical protein
MIVLGFLVTTAFQSSAFALATCRIAYSTQYTASYYYNRPQVPSNNCAPTYQYGVPYEDWRTKSTEICQWNFNYYTGQFTKYAVGVKLEYQRGQEVCRETLFYNN